MLCFVRKSHNCLRFSELKTLSLAMDLLLAHDKKRAMDVLVLRWKALSLHANGQAAKLCSELLVPQCAPAFAHRDIACSIVSLSDDHHRK